jgi:hypothetical protein
MSIDERIIRHGPSGKPATLFFDVQADLAAGSSDTLFVFTLPTDSSVDVSIKLEARASAKRTSWRWFSVYENIGGVAAEQPVFRTDTTDEDDAAWSPAIAVVGTQLVVTMNADAALATSVQARIFIDTLDVVDGAA